MSEKVTEINKPEDNEMKLKLSREYDFEGQKICEIDLSGLDNLTAADMIQANKVLTNNGTVSVLPETTLEDARQPWKRRPVFSINRYRKCNGKYRKSAHHRSHDAGNRARCHIREGVRIRR